VAVPTDPAGDVGCEGQPDPDPVEAGHWQDDDVHQGGPRDEHKAQDPHEPGEVETTEAGFHPESPPGGEPGDQDSEPGAEEQKNSEEATHIRILLKDLQCSNDLSRYYIAELAF
jgi:hypothetical protein